MALSRVKTWASGETLTASDLNGEFNNILNNAATLISPLTAGIDLDGFTLTIDSDADSTLRATADDVVALRLQGMDAFIFDGNVTSPVNGVTLVSSATGVAPTIMPHGTDSNIGLRLADSNNSPMLALAAVASGVNEITITNAATGNRPRVAASGSDTNVSLETRPKGTGTTVFADGNGNEVVILAAGTASAVNEVTFTNAATGSNPSISATGGDTNISINLAPKGTGVLQQGGTAVALTGKHMIPVYAGQMVPRVTNGAARSVREQTTNDNMTDALAFDQTTQEFAQFEIEMPESWDEGTVTFIPVWTAASGTGGVVWALQGVAQSNDDAIDVAFGTEQTSTDTLIATNDRHKGPVSSAITIGGTPAAGDTVQFTIKRNVSDGSDTLTADAELLEIRLYITLAAGNDA